MFVKLNICANCLSSLSKPAQVPHLALANNLYRGELPFYFCDLTWVEERVCAVYCLTAHVTCLFQSSDLSQPHIFHGNTCTHDVNVVSTASALPRTPADVNGYLSIVFFGPSKFDLKNLGSMFHVWKGKIWCFLVWLKDHNDDMLPGLTEQVIEDHELNA
ncbi:hypothetical protein PAXRUDRAFT_36494 [Paxillus rubicundulus Ve08.2h10]|uniref:DUF6570 domain-containing protein n=1 Tax=Paxillus rubicundulus Ve08.2h10 TaxID=930991 RepID=A0A0D0CUN2_9AGAM|nr:hypothetical protein PAXRUDRAFT_36494 [Paxillus rubicundulus Ve08.2h10]